VIGHTIPDIDIDWLGLHATRLNGHLLRTIFYDIAHPRIIENYDHKIENLHERLVIGAGWKPGFSSDFCAIQLAEDYGVRTVINMTNIDKAYDKDPNKFSDAKSIDTISWNDFRKIVGDEWKPGMNAPFDPIASRKADMLGATVVIMGSDFQNLTNYLDGNSFVGTIIK
jgi:uridylate kinase